MSSQGVPQDFFFVLVTFHCVLDTAAETTGTIIQEPIFRPGISKACLFVCCYFVENAFFILIEKLFFNCNIDIDCAECNLCHFDFHKVKATLGHM